MKQFLTKRNFGLTLAFLFLISQFKTIDKTPDKLNPSADFLILEDASKEIIELFETSYFDCQLSSTNYPCYKNVAQIRWWIKRHVDNKKHKINYSKWIKYKSYIRAHKIDETIKYIGKEWMHLGSFKWVHSEARLKDSMRNMLIEWLESTK